MSVCKMATRDYRKRQKPAVRAMPYKGFLLGSAFGLTLGLSATALVYAYFTQMVLDGPGNVPQAFKAPNDDVSRDPLPGSGFDFFDTLPSFVLIPNEQKDAKGRKSQHITQYILQAESFNEVKRAEHYQEKLASMGHTVKIRKEIETGKQTYRVWLGPYSAEKASSAIKTLKDQGVQVLIKEHRPPRK